MAGHFKVKFDQHFVQRVLLSRLTTNVLIVSVVVIFLSEVILFFTLLLGMAMYANEVETTKTKNYLR